MMPKKFHRIWLGNKRMPHGLQVYWKRFHTLHPDWEFKTWTKVDFPLLTGDLFGLQTDLQCAANILRLEILYKYGGVYVDCEVEPIKSFDPLTCFTCFCHSQRGGGLNNMIMGAVPEHKMVLMLLRHLQDMPVEAVASHLVSRRTGPGLITKYWLESSMVTRIEETIFTRDHITPHSMGIQWVSGKSGLLSAKGGESVRERVMPVDRIPLLREGRDFPSANTVFKCAFMDLEGCDNFVVKAVQSTDNPTIYVGEQDGYLLRIIMNRNVDAYLGRVPQIELTSSGEDGTKVHFSSLLTLAEARFVNEIGPGRLLLQQLNRMIPHDEPRRRCCGG